MEVFTEFTPTFLIFVKIAIWLFLLLYILFAGVVIKQVRVMTETLQVGAEKSIRLAAVIHFVAAISVFLLSLILL